MVIVHVGFVVELGFRMEGVAIVLSSHIFHLAGSSNSDPGADRGLLQIAMYLPALFHDAVHRCI